MSDAVIKVEGLSKRYRIGQYVGGGAYQYRALRDVLTDVMYAPFHRLRARSKQRAVASNPTADSHELSAMSYQPSANFIWALKDVSFEVKQGEVVGIIGRNGAVKSTLLKVLSRITEPTKGRAMIKGRLGSLLEVGTGFHPELTGRENVYLSGAILGMTKKEIGRKFNEIVDFSGIEKFIDTPVKRYSSGMLVRLGFAVAAHLEPEILLVDEVLAVGDVVFQKKCLGKMQNVSKEGRTVLFVSHNMVAVQNLCGRAIWLNDGRIVEEGQPDQVVSNYLQTSFSTVKTEQVWDDIATAPGNEKVRLRHACVRPTNGSPLDPITIQTSIVLEFEYWNLVPDAYLNLSLSLFNDQGVEIFATAPLRETIWHSHPFPAGLFRSTCNIPGDLLNDGTYRVRLRVVQKQTVGVYCYDDLLVFEVCDAVEMRGSWYGKWPGAVRPNLEWTTELIEAGKPSISPARQS